MDRVHNEDRGLELAGRAKDNVEVGRRQQVTAVDGRPEAFGTAPDLFAGFLRRYEKRAPALGRKARQRLEDERGLADARLAAEHGHRTGDQPATENPVELANSGRHCNGAVRADRT